MLSLLLLAGCTMPGVTRLSEEIPESTKGKDLTTATAADNVFTLNCNMKYSFNPLIATSHFNQLVCALIYENMVELDNNFNVIPNIITEWSCSEDAKSWTLKIDTTRSFHDGSPVTAYDVRYSLERAINSDRYLGRFSSIQGISYWGDDTVYVTLGIGDSQFIKLLNIPVIAYGTYGDKKPGGCGPYMYNEDETALVVFPGYPNADKLPFDTVYLQEYTTQDAIISAFEDSLIDVVINDPSSYTNLGYASTNETHTYATTNLHFVAWNEESTLGQFANFRYAMQYAFDREYLETLLKGNAVASSVPMYPTCDIYPTELANSIRYNMDTCMTVLENAGIRDYDEDGLLEYMSGSPQDIELTLILCSDSSAKAGIANRFAQDMASIGLTINVKELTWTDYIKALTRDYEKDEKEIDYDLYYGEVRLRNNFDLTELLQVRTEDNETSNINFTNTRDTNYLVYIENYLMASDNDRARRYEELCSYIIANGSFISIGFEKQQIITHRGVIKGLKTNMGNPFMGITEWEVNLG